VVYRLSLAILQESDYGNYTCEAVNAVGRGTDTYQLRGQPDQPVVVSGTQSTGQTFYLLGWQVWTPASLPILNQSILYRLRKKVRRNEELAVFHKRRGNAPVCFYSFSMKIRG
jgi:hypothetical protein